MPRECSCGGSNENCIHCFGTGIRGGRVMAESSLVSPPITDLGPGFERCPYCQLSFRPERLRHHLRTSHPAMIGLKKATSHVTVLQAVADSLPQRHKEEVVRCIRCGANVRRHELDAHFFAHTTVDLRSASPGPGSVGREATNVRAGSRIVGTTRRSKLLPDMVPCPYCPSPVRQKNLQKHCLHVHGRSSPRTAPSSKPSTPLSGQTAPVISKHASRSADVQPASAPTAVPASKSFNSERNKRGTTGSHTYEYSPIFFCDRCEFYVAQKNWEAHLARSHPGMSVRRPPDALRQESRRGTTQRRRRSTMVKKTTAGQQRLVRDPNERAERRMDATREYSNYRELGRFGSHPSHDDFSDEGNA